METHRRWTEPLVVRSSASPPFVVVFFFTLWIYWSSFIFCHQALTPAFWVPPHQLLTVNRLNRSLSICDLTPPCYSTKALVRCCFQFYFLTFACFLLILETSYSLLNLTKTTFTLRWQYGWWLLDTFSSSWELSASSEGFLCQSFLCINISFSCPIQLIVGGFCVGVWAVYTCGVNRSFYRVYRQHPKGHGWWSNTLLLLNSLAALVQLS